MKRMVVSDIDGTLLNNSKKVSETDLRTLHLLHELNVIRVLATGRSLYSVNKVLQDDFPIDYLIFSSGAGILDWNNKEILNSNQFNQHEVQNIVEIFLSLDIDFMVHQPIPHNHNFLYHHTGNHADTDFLDRLKLYQPFCSPFIPGVEFPNGATQIIAILPNNIELFNKISKDLTECKVIRTTSPIDGISIWMEIFPTVVSKAQGIEWLCSKTSTNIDKILVIGNDYNDLDMLNLTPNSFIVENAPVDLKKLFKEAPSNEESGFSFAVYNWLQSN